MKLSDDLISQLVKVTNDRPAGKNDVVVYGTIRDDGSRKYVQIDGSEEFTPVETAVEISHGDRVTVSVRNHAATITGNISDPAIGTKTADGLRSSITQTAEQIRLELSNEITGMESKLNLTAEEIRSEVSDQIGGFDSRIKQNADSIESMVSTQDEFSKFKQTVEGFSFMGNGGTVKISGGDINLTGSITFTDLTKDTQDKIDGASEDAADALETANGISSTASLALSRANTAMGDAEEALDTADNAAEIARSIAAGTYVQGTFINGTSIKSPTIEGNDIKVYGTFQTKGYDGVTMITTGYMGAAKGKALYNGSEQDSYGVALARTWNSDTLQVSKSYVIVTDYGVRLQYDTNSLTVSNDGIWINASNGKAYYNGTGSWVEIGSGSGGNVVPVWG